MRVLLLGATGNLGLRLIPALLIHNHHVVVYVRSPSKLRSLVPPSLLSRIVTVIGDATDSPSIQNAITEHDCDAIVDTAGNQVLPWKEHLLPKIAKAVADAAVAVGRARGKPLRAWLIGGLGSLQYPGTGYLVQDYLPRVASIQLHGTASVLDATPLSDLRWSLLCVAIMKPEYPTIEPLAQPRTHGLLVKAGSPPGWEDHWVRDIPLVGPYLNLIVEISNYTTKLEDVADLVAEDLESDGPEWVGKRVGMKERRKGM